MNMNVTPQTAPKGTQKGPGIARSFRFIARLSALSSGLSYDLATILGLLDHYGLSLIVVVGEHDYS